MLEIWGSYNTKCIAHMDLFYGEIMYTAPLGTQNLPNESLYQCSATEKSTIFLQIWAVYAVYGSSYLPMGYRKDFNLDHIIRLF